MSIAREQDAGKTRPRRIAAALGRLLAVGIILAPLVVMLFPELNRRSEDKSLQSTQDAVGPQPSAAEPVLNIVVFRRTVR
jgi:hypothetical protein